MADRTESSITVDAAPADVMAVIADFAAYPEWTGAVKEVEIRETAPDGRAKEVWFKLDAGAIKDQYTLDYTWKGRQRGALEPGRGRADRQGHGRCLPARRQRRRVHRR